MAFFDLPLEQLRQYTPDIPEPEDFDNFWKQTIEEARTLRKEISVKAIPSDFSLLSFYDVRFSGAHGQEIHAWLILPAAMQDEALPCVIEFLGYGGGRGFPHSRPLGCLRLCSASHGYSRAGISLGER